MRIAVLLLGVILFFSNCDKKVNSTAEVKTLDSLLVQVEESERIFLDLPHEDIKARLDSIKSTISFVEANYGGEMNKEDALLLDKLRGTKSIVKRFGDRTSQMKTEFIRTKNQLSNFKEALISGATHDKNNQEMTPEYIQKNMELEKSAAENLISSVSELTTRSQRFIEQNDEKRKAIQPYLNSLK